MAIERREVPTRPAVLVGLCLMFFVSIVLSQTIKDCPRETFDTTTGKGCYCTRKFSIFWYIYCEKLGNITKLPYFKPTTRTFDELHIRIETTVERIQKDAFVGIILHTLRLQGLGIQVIEVGSFAGLSQYLSEIHLDDNKIQDIPSDVFKDLTKVSYLGLQNNDIREIHSHTFNGMENLRYLYLFHNKIPGL